MKYLGFMVLMFGTACLILFSGFVLPTVIALIVLVSAVTFDFYTTWRCLKKNGTEGNPIIALVLKKLGLLKAFGVMAGIWVCFIAFRWLNIAEGPQTAVAFAYWLVPINNLIVLRRLQRA